MHKPVMRVHHYSELITRSSPTPTSSGRICRFQSCAIADHETLRIHPAMVCSRTPVEARRWRFIGGQHGSDFYFSTGARTLAVLLFDKSFSDSSIRSSPCCVEPNGPDLIAGLFFFSSRARASSAAYRALNSARRGLVDNRVGRACPTKRRRRAG